MPDAPSIRSLPIRPSTVPRRLGAWLHVTGLVVTGLLVTGLPGTDPAFAKEIPFGAEQSIGVSFDGALSVDIGDIDGDGDLDVVGSATEDGDISWFENTAGDGSAWTERVVDADFPQAQSVRLTDLEDDGDLDILATSRGDSLVRYWRNLGGGASWSAFDIETNFANAVFAVGADLDSNSKFDVVAASLTGVTWWWNRFGTGIFFERRDIEVTADRPTSLHVDDLDGDGDPDVLVTFAGTDEVAWYENTAGDASAWTRRSIAVGFGGAQSVTASDVDGDGDLDVVAAALTDDEVTWWENAAGDAGTWTERVIDSDFREASSVEARDLDGDGDIDVLGAASSLGEVEWWENTAGDGTAWTARPLPGTFFGAAAAVSGDIDSDGDQDVVAAALGADAVSWWENHSIHRSAAYPTASSVATSLGAAGSIHSADIDGDGDEDLVGADDSAGDVLWWENAAGDGSSWTERTVDDAFAGANGVYAADIDADGDIDIGGTSGSQGLIVWWRNEAGDGSSWTRQSVASLPAAREPQVIDIDDDGDLDIVAVSPVFFRVVSWINLDGRGTSWFQRIMQGNYPGARSSYGVDFDGDDRPDFATAASTFNAVSFVRNPVTGFQSTIIDSNFPEAFSVFGADLDGDGDNDILAASRSTGEIAWYENTDGSGAFAPRQAIVTGFMDVTQVLAADLDADGDVDIVATRDGGDQVAWWANGGDGSSWTPQTVDGALDGANWARIADFDGDGQPDLAAAGSGGDVDWWRNRGGELALPTADVAPALVAEGVTAAVLRIDAAHRGRVGDSSIELVTVEVLLESAPGTPATDAEADSLMSRLGLHADDGSGVFEAALDSEIASISVFSLQDGLATFTLADGLAGAQLAPAESRSYFVVPSFEADAASAMLDDFRFTHVTEASSMGEDAAADLPVSLEFSSNVTSSAVAFNTPPVAQADALALLEDQPATANVLDGSAGGLDSDNEGGPLTAILVSGPTNGALVGGLAEGGGFEYLPNADFVGVDAFTYRASDGLSLSAETTVSLTISAVNDPPSFAVGAEDRSAEDAGPRTVPGFATAISAGPADEAGQSVSFTTVSVSNPDLFAAQPALAPDGTLTYEAAADAVGSATVEVRLGDDGGTADGGVDQSALVSFTVAVDGVNDAPSFTLPDAAALSLEDAGPRTVAGFAADIAAGPADEAAQSLTFSVLSNDNPGLFSQPPALSADGTLTYASAADANGTAVLTVALSDDGGTADGGVDTSPPRTVTIRVGAVNDPPSFALAATPPGAPEDAGPQSIAGFATGLLAGPADEAAQILTFEVTGNSNPGLFSQPPALSADGTLTFTGAADRAGSATVTVALVDDGGVADGGVDRSPEQSFDIAVAPVNDPPSFTAVTLEVSTEDAGPRQVPSFATAISAGPADEAGQTVSFVVDVDAPELFAAAPAISADGTLTYTADADANGTAALTVSLVDDGGTAAGGVDQSAPQTVTLVIEPVNDAPSFVAPGVLEIDAASTPQVFPGFASAISAGPVDEDGQQLSFELAAVSAPELFARLPAVSSTGELTFTLVEDLSDVSAEISLRLRDDGGTAAGGVDVSDIRVTELVVPDVAAPDVVGVRAGPVGAIEACTELRRRIGGLTVTYSEPMSTDGAGAGSALDPAITS